MPSTRQPLPSQRWYALVRATRRSGHQGLAAASDGLRRRAARFAALGSLVAIRLLAQPARPSGITRRARRLSDCAKPISLARSGAPADASLTRPQAGHHEATHNSGGAGRERRGIPRRGRYPSTRPSSPPPVSGGPLLALVGEARLPQMPSMPRAGFDAGLLTKAL